MWSNRSRIEGIISSHVILSMEEGFNPGSRRCGERGIEGALGSIPA